MKVRFEDALKLAAKKGPGAIQSVKAQIVTPDGEDAGQPLRLDLELADSAATAGRYSSLVEVLNRQIQIRELILSEGR
jgi:flagellar basal-body rod protein FlgB